MDLTVVLTEAVCCFPTERQSLLMYQKIERRQKEKPYREKLISINVLSPGLTPRPRIVAGVTFCRASQLLKLLSRAVLPLR